MKHSDKIAYESEGSTTRRFTPEELGLLLAKCSPPQLVKVRNSYNQHQIMYMPLAIREVVADLFSAWAIILRPKE